VSERLPDIAFLVRELQCCSLFRELAEPDLARIAPLLAERHVEAGTLIVRQGEPTSELFIVRDGLVEVTKRAPGASHDHQLTTLGPGTTFGELALADRAPRSASVRALTDTTVAVLDLDEFESATAHDDGIQARMLGNLTGYLGRRLRDVSEVTVVALERELELARTRVAMGTFITYVVFLMAWYGFALRLVSDLVRSAADSTLVTIPITLGFAVPLYVMMRRSGEPIATYGLTWRGARRGMRDAVLWTLPVLALCVVVKAVLVRTVPSLAGAPIFRFGGFLDPTTSPGDAWFTLAFSLAYLVLVPIQEFVARGALQGPLQRFLVGPRSTLLAIVIATAMFSVSHLYLSTTFALIAMVPSLLWGWLYARHGTLAAPIVSHALIGWWALFVLGFDRILT
jgi:CRP-like cAMP-binding protein